MATYETDKSRSSGIVAGPGGHRETVTDFVSVAMTTAMLDNANDDVGLMYVPAGAVIISATLSATDMDTAGSPALAIDVGDSNDEDRLFAASTVGQAGTLSTALARTGHLYKYTSKTQLRAYIQTAAGTAAAGTLNFSVTYVVDPDYVTTALTAA
jgi:hypothetical protein